VIRLVQQNAPQAEKWDRDHAARFYRRLIEGTAARPDPALGPPDAVIWPETALTFLPQDRPDLLEQMAGAAGDARLIAGAMFFRMEDGARHWSNALIALDRAGGIAARYDKHHLVPFGEYLPLAPLLSAIGLDAIAGMPGGGFTPGPGPRVLDLAGLPPFAPAICYEMIFPQGLVPDGTRPDWILHLTNDAWFGAFAGPQQHLAQARIRAIERGLPVARAAQTGISAMIDPWGRVTAAIGLDRHGHVDAALPAPLAPTPYARAGDLPALAALLLMWLAVAGAHYFRRPD
jgi:apolipoprotein N-acyltransferase